MCTITFLPAAITLFRPAAEAARSGFPGPLGSATAWRADAARSCGVFAALAVLALAVSPRLSFDSDPLDTQNPNTEAMRTLRDLMS